MNEPLTDEDLRWALANYKDTDWRYLAAAEIRQLRRELAEAKAERDALRHSDALIADALKQFKTDCSTPTFQLARNAVEQLTKGESERDAARRELADAKATIENYRSSMLSEQQHDEIEGLEQQLAEAKAQIENQIRIDGIHALCVTIESDLKQQLAEAIRERDVLQGKLLIAETYIQLRKGEFK